MNGKFFKIDYFLIFVIKRDATEENDKNVLFNRRNILISQIYKYKKNKK